MPRWHGVLLVLALLSWSAWCLPAQAGTVSPADYHAFWLWGGVPAPHYLDGASDVYVLQGEVAVRGRDHAATSVMAQGVAMPHGITTPIWLTYRAQTLHWDPGVYRMLLGDLLRWRDAGNRVVGVQIDFDARTRHLDEYIAFLRDLRMRLPADYRLSITGLMDWSSRADPEQVRLLRGVVDEIVVQTYQGRHTITDYAAYLPRVAQLQLPFRIGLVEGGQWEPQRYLQDSPWFRSYVVFLLPRS